MESTDQTNATKACSSTHDLLVAPTATIANQCETSAPASGGTSNHNASAAQLMKRYCTDRYYYGLSEFELVAAGNGDKDVFNSLSNIVNTMISLMKNINKDKTLPIHLEPNADNKVSMWSSEYRWVVANANDITLDNGLYMKTILPAGWMQKSCLDDGNEQILSKVTSKTFDQFHKPMTEDELRNNIGFCAENCSWFTNCIRGITLKIRKQPIYLMAVFLFLHFLSECVIFADLITDIAVAVTLARAHKSVLYSSFVSDCFIY